MIEHRPGNRAIHRTGIDVNEAEPPGELARYAALARGSRAVNCHYAMFLSFHLFWRERARRAQFFAGGTPKQARDYSSTGAAGTSVPITGVLVRTRLGLINSFRSFSKPGYDSRMQSASWMIVSPSAKSAAT